MQGVAEIPAGSDRVTKPEKGGGRTFEHLPVVYMKPHEPPGGMKWLSVTVQFRPKKDAHLPVRGLVVRTDDGAAAALEAISCQTGRKKPKDPSLFPFLFVEDAVMGVGDVGSSGRGGRVVSGDFTIWSPLFHFDEEAKQMQGIGSACYVRGDIDRQILTLVKSLSGEFEIQSRRREIRIALLFAVPENATIFTLSSGSGEDLPLTPGKEEFR